MRDREESIIQTLQGISEGLRIGDLVTTKFTFSALENGFQLFMRGRDAACGVPKPEVKPDVPGPGKTRHKGTCGHFLTPDEVFQDAVPTKDRSRSGRRAISWVVLCGNCYEEWDTEGQIFAHHRDAYAWMLEDDN